MRCPHRIRTEIFENSKEEFFMECGYESCQFFKRINFDKEISLSCGNPKGHFLVFEKREEEK